MRREKIIERLRGWKRAVRSWFYGGWPFYWIRTHTIHRYHIINISGQDGYKWGWIDRSHAMELACWKILVEFVEEEDPRVGLRTIKDYYPDEGPDEWGRQAIQFQLADEREVRELYEWWKTGRKKEWDACYALWKAPPFEDRIREIPGTDTFEWLPPKSPDFDAFCKEHQRLEEKDQEMLVRLIKIHGRLWT